MKPLNYYKHFFKANGFKLTIKELIQNQFTWIVGEDNELGFRFLGMNFYYYKWENPMLFNGGKWRKANKREFGEIIQKGEQ